MQSLTIPLEFSYQAVKSALLFSTVYPSPVYNSITLKTHLLSAYYVDTMP